MTPWGKTIFRANQMTPYQAYLEAYDAGKRLPELEDIILTDPNISFQYAADIIKGKLPEKMHNMMLLYAIKDPDDYGVKEYFELIK